MNSRAKGARLEREAARAVEESLGLPARRSARNGVTGAADIVGTPGIRFEVKGRASLAVARFLDQARAEAAPGEVPAVLMRENGGQWLLMVELGSFTALAVAVARAIRGE